MRAAEPRARAESAQVAESAPAELPELTGVLSGNEADEEAAETQLAGNSTLSTWAVLRPARSFPSPSTVTFNSMDAYRRFFLCEPSRLPGRRRMQQAAMEAVQEAEALSMRTMQLRPVGRVPLRVMREGADAVARYLPAREASMRAIGGEDVLR